MFLAVFLSKRLLVVAVDEASLSACRVKWVKTLLTVNVCQRPRR